VRFVGGIAQADEKLVILLDAETLLRHDDLPRSTSRARPAERPGRAAMSFPVFLRGMSDREYTLFRDLVHRETGIALGPHKRGLLEARLTKRLRALQLASFSAYHEYLRTHDASGEERRRFVNAMTTNETAFFREPAHFEHLTATWLPARRAAADAGGRGACAPGAPRAAPARSRTRSR
jgi:hypothetical protein